jgi:hypothetical protein
MRNVKCAVSGFILTILFLGGCALPTSVPESAHVKQLQEQAYS